MSTGPYSYDKKGYIRLNSRRVIGEMYGSRDTEKLVRRANLGYRMEQAFEDYVGGAEANINLSEMRVERDVPESSTDDIPDEPVGCICSEEVHDPDIYFPRYKPGCPVHLPFGKCTCCPIHGFRRGSRQD